MCGLRHKTLFVQSTGCRVQGAGYMVQGTGYRVQSTGGFVDLLKQEVRDLASVRLTSTGELDLHVLALRERWRGGGGWRVGRE